MLLSTLISAAVVILIFVHILFVLSLVTKRNDFADVAWGIGIALVAVTSFLVHQPASVLSKVFLICISLWGVRLAWRILRRNLKRGEDYRYKAWREEWGKWFYLRSYFQVYLLQGFLMIVVGYSAVHASVFAVQSNTGFLAAGLLIWLIGFYFEVVADAQLDRFIADSANRGKLLTSGLWRYSRHPNYFGEVIMWWGLWLTLASTPCAYIALVSPLTITFLILKVSGIPMLEAKYAGRADFEEYKRTTNAFFPWWPKKDFSRNP